MRLSYKVVNIATGAVLISALSSVSHNVFDDSVWLSRIFLAATAGFVIFCVMRSLRGIDKRSR
jgi:hypothetical protein